MATTDDRIVLNEITNSKAGLSAAILDKVRAPVEPQMPPRQPPVA